MAVQYAEPGTAVEVGKLDGHQKRIPATVVPLPVLRPREEAPAVVDPTPPHSLPGAGRNQSLARAFQVLDCLAAHPAGVSVAAVARATGLPRATVTRLLGSLADEGAARREAAAGGSGRGSRSSRAGRAAAARARRRRCWRRSRRSSARPSCSPCPTGRPARASIAEAAGPRMVGVGSWLGRTLEDPASGFVRLRLAALEPAARRRAVAGLRFTAHTREHDPLRAAAARGARARSRATGTPRWSTSSSRASPASPSRCTRTAGWSRCSPSTSPPRGSTTPMRARALAALRRAAQSLTGASETTISSSSSQTR